MGMVNKKAGTTDPTPNGDKHSESSTPENRSVHHHGAEVQHNDTVSTAPTEKPKVKFIAVLLGAIASMGGMIFGYESGQISGFMNMSDYIDRFADHGKFDATRSGTIVGLLSVGSLLGCLTSGVIADNIGRKWTIFTSALVYIVGVIIEITSTRHWVQFAIGRLITGLGVGSLSTAVPMYQSETVPKNIRSMVVASYQLMITIGIWLSYMINFGTEAKYSNDAQWRIPVGISALWALFLCVGITLMPESPRYSFRMGREEEARGVFARLAGVSRNAPIVNEEIEEIEEKHREELEAGKAHWTGIFTGPGMLHRTLLGMALQAGQQLTGANFFFYYGTTIFKSTGISNSYVTSIILGSVNVASTIFGIWIVKKVNRRPALMVGAGAMAICFLIFAFVGQFELSVTDPLSTPQAGYIMIAFTCIFIFFFATTWGPMVWSQVAELYPIEHRATCLALATSCNWLFNFLISFFTTFITDAIHYYYGLVFAGCCIGMVFVVMFFMLETKNRSLEEVDTMYRLGVNPFKSSSWDATAYKDEKKEHNNAVHGEGGVVEAPQTKAEV